MPHLTMVNNHESTTNRDDSTMVDYADRLQQALDRAGLSIAELAAALGVTYQAVRKVLKRESRAFSAENNDHAARAMRVSPSWLATGQGSMEDGVLLKAEEPGNPYVAQQMSQRPWTMDLLGTPTWEQLLTMKSRDELATHFQVAAPDNAMAPRLKQGVKATFERDLEPQFGDGVLVRDSAGDLHIRYYRRGRPGTWEAHAESADYAPLISDRDGLEVWAVLTAVEGRWS
jgi:transcriptional regulator with XRE-family HTH domain